MEPEPHQSPCDRQSTDYIGTTKGKMKMESSSGNVNADQLNIANGGNRNRRGRAPGPDYTRSLNDSTAGLVDKNQRYELISGLPHPRRHAIYSKQPVDNAGDVVEKERKMTPNLRPTSFAPITEPTLLWENDIHCLDDMTQILSTLQPPLLKPRHVLTTEQYTQIEAEQPHLAMSRAIYDALFLRPLYRGDTITKNSALFNHGCQYPKQTRAWCRAIVETLFRFHTKGLNIEEKDLFGWEADLDLDLRTRFNVIRDILCFSWGIGAIIVTSDHQEGMKEVKRLVAGPLATHALQKEFSPRLAGVNTNNQEGHN